MRITKRRIRKPDNYLLGINPGDNFYVASPVITNANQQLLINAGFTPALNIGEQVLPTVNKAISKFNANGGFITLKGQPKVPAQREFTFQDWHGNWHTKMIDYERYPRQILPAPLIEISIVENLQGEKIARSPLLNNSPGNHNMIKHTINLFLELFGECEILQDNLLPALNIPITRLNWDILPPGNYPWATLQPRIQMVINNTPINTRQAIQDRFEFLSSYTPNFVATGRAGFKGYFVFGYPKHDFYILESIFEGNATYVLGQDWNVVAQLSKGEILDNQLHQYRFLHNDAWQKNINDIM
ncbi:hypothetical protein GWR56_08375 [Mucilaginibacter sp. 14171R-50]|uniref:hypothetical protein n=1 Tax=Mucilaginibacter sp. 14171R-50 TaxID=2703789 RepID=UPI00138D9A6E|nr:hypothetical protein [Mucilaginibacter sp. 14171R-50]QHS55556.1 hypothetical protein GWR56_08375 [Mucilaginibacter sp. 14171R-50]